MPINVFIASDPIDRSLLDKFLAQLGNLIRQGTITIWRDDTMLAGSDQDQERMAQLNQTQLILLLISADFINSEHYPRLLQRALARNRTERTPVIPILLRSTDIVGAPFAGLVLLPRDGRAVSQWPTHDEAFTDIMNDLRQTITALQRGAPAEKHTSASQQASLWSVPPRNPYFTGREALLTHLRETLANNRQAALTQSVAISGLGGIGKTQTATEYAYRYRNDYQHIFWVKAETRQELLGDLASTAHALDLAEPQEQNQIAAVQAMLRWLETHSNWLLILDNADDLKMVSEYLPRSSTGHILLTTRADAPGTLARKVEVSTMSTQEGVLFLLRRAGLITQDAATPDAAPVAEQTAAADLVHELDGLPLALDQAGAYIEETRYSVSRYLPLYRQQRTKLLSRRGGLNPDHPTPVATTWSLSFNNVEQAHPAAADLLRLCSFLSPEAIPEDIFTKGASHLGPRLQPVASDPLALNEAIGELLKYSLVSRDAPSQTLTVHRLVQAVLKDGMNKQAQRRWAERAVKAVSEAFQGEEHEIWSIGKRFFPHAQACTDLVEQWAFAFAEAALLLNQAAYYLDTCLANYQGTLPLLEQAIAIYEQVPGLQHPYTATSLNNLALLYYNLGQYEQALPLHQRALAIREQVPGPQHPATATSLNNLAMLYGSLGQYEQALPLLQRALAILEKVIPHHPNTVTARKSYAHLLQVMQQGEQS